jgi:hypothetical protein
MSVDILNRTYKVDNGNNTLTEIKANDSEEWFTLLQEFKDLSR